MERKNKINIFELADANADHLKEEYLRLKENCDKNKSGLLESFRRKIQEEWNLSINMKDWALADFLDSGEYKNIYYLKEEQASQLLEIGKLESSEKEDSLEISLRKHLKKFYQSRIIFDSGIVDGEKIKYTALNIGGTGINRYARYCVIIKREDAENYNTLSFIKEDSAVHYVENQRLLIDKLSQDISNKECMDLLAALKHEDEINTVSIDKWAAVICSNSGYIEAVTLDDILDSHITCVRVEKAFYDSIYMDSLLKLFYSELSEEEHYRLAFFQRLLTQLEAKGIDLEIIDEN